MPEIVIAPGIEPGGLELLETIILDPLSEDPNNSPLVLSGRHSGHGIYLVSHAYPPAERHSIFASSVATEGQKRSAPGQPDNRTISTKLWIAEQAGIDPTFNLCTNPKAGRDISDWEASGVPPTFERAVLGSPIGVPIAREPGCDTAFHLDSTQGVDFPLDVDATRQYFFSLYCYAVNLDAGGVRLRVRDELATVKAQSDPLTEFEVWQRLGVGLVASDDQTYTFELVPTGAGGVEIYFTAVLIEASAVLGPWGDGDVPGWNWLGETNRSVSARVGSGVDGRRFIAAYNDLEAKVSKLFEEGGTYKRILPSGDEIVFDVVEAQIPTGPGDRPFNQGRAEFDVNFLCEPYGRGPEEALPLREETIKPVLVAVESGIKGTAKASGRLVVTDESGNDQWTGLWGAEVLDHDPTGIDNEKLFFQAEDLTPVGGAGAVAAAGANGGQALQSGVRTPVPSSMMSTKLDVGGNLQHFGTYRVFARCKDLAGVHRAAFQWGAGDLLSYRENDPIGCPVADEWCILDLGVIQIPRVEGVQRWAGRLVVWTRNGSTQTNTFLVDCIWLEPAGVGSGEWSGVARLGSAPNFVVRDGFDYGDGPGPLAGHADWGGTGPSPFWIDEPDEAQAFRSPAADPDESGGRYEWVTTDAFGAIAFRATISMINLDADHGAVRGGIFLRFTDIDHRVMAVIRSSGPADPAELRFYRKSGGADELLGTAQLAPKSRNIDKTEFTIEAAIDAAGRYTVWCAEASSPLGDPKITGWDSTLAAGGALESGRVGLYQATIDGLIIMTADDVAGWVLTSDAAVYASQSAEIRGESILREDSLGTILTRPSLYDGDYLKPLPSGREDRYLRYLVKLSRGDLETMPDWAIDELSAQLFYTPRYDNVPEPQ